DQEAPEPHARPAARPPPPQGGPRRHRQDRPEQGTERRAILRSPEGHAAEGAGPSGAARGEEPLQHRRQIDAQATHREAPIDAQARHREAGPPATAGYARRAVDEPSANASAEPDAGGVATARRQTAAAEVRSAAWRPGDVSPRFAASGG